MPLPVKSPTDTFAVLKPNLEVEPIPVSPGVYEELDAKYSGFKNHVLIASHEFSEDWPTWERHPAGDEIVMLLSGEVTLVTQTRSGNESVVLDNPGSYIIIPRDTWHTAQVSKPARMLFVTPGEGTENLEEPPTQS